MQLKRSAWKSLPLVISFKLRNYIRLQALELRHKKEKRKKNWVENFFWCWYLLYFSIFISDMVMVVRSEYDFKSGSFFSPVAIYYFQMADSGHVFLSFSHYFPKGKPQFLRFWYFSNRRVFSSRNAGPIFNLFPFAWENRFSFR